MMKHIKKSYQHALIIITLTSLQSCIQHKQDPGIYLDVDMDSNRHKFEQLQAQHPNFFPIYYSEMASYFFNLSNHARTDPKHTAYNKVPTYPKQPQNELDFDTTLNFIAQKYACTMANHGYFSHTDHNGNNAWDRAIEQGWNDTKIGENLAYTQTPKHAIMNLMNSLGHRSNLLDKDYIRLGVGICHISTKSLKKLIQAFHPELLTVNPNNFLNHYMYVQIFST